MARGSSSKRRGSESPPSSSSDDSALGSVECVRDERVVTRSESERQRNATWDRVTQSVRRGIRSAGCRSVGVVDGVRSSSSKRIDRSNKPEIPPEVGAKGGGGEVSGKGKDKGEVDGGCKGKSADMPGGEGVEEVVKSESVVVDGIALETVEFVSTIDYCLVELEKIRRILSQLSPLLAAASSAMVLEGKTVLEEKERIYESMLARATERVILFPRIVISYVRVYEYPKAYFRPQIHILIPKDSPVLAVLAGLAGQQGLMFSPYTYF